MKILMSRTLGFKCFSENRRVFQLSLTINVAKVKCGCIPHNNSDLRMMHHTSCLGTNVFCWHGNKRISLHFVNKLWLLKLL